MAPVYRIERREVFNGYGCLHPYSDNYRMVDAATGREVLGWGVTVSTLRRRARQDGATVVEPNKRTRRSK